MSIEQAIKEMSFDALNREIKRTMRRSAKDAVQLGYMLRRMMEEGMWTSVYVDFDSYLREELNMEYSMANRFININKKYSWNGNSAEIDTKYEDYSQGTLIEMLSMNPEQMQKVTSDMTVKQVRDIKKQTRKPVMVEVVPGVAVEIVDVEKASEAAEKEVLKAEIEAVPERCIEETEVATSQGISPYGFQKTTYPEGSLIVTEGCGHKHVCFSCAQECDIRQKKRYCVEAPMGKPFNCTTMEVINNLKDEIGEQCQFVNNDKAYHRMGDNSAVPCCKNCLTPCGYICRRAVDVNENLSKTAEMKTEVESKESEENLTLKTVLEESKVRLHNMLATPERFNTRQIEKQKIIVGALDAAVCELEENKVSEMEEPKQPELPILKNNEQRKEWLRNFRAWGLWYADENIGAEYYKYDFPDGTRLIAETYPKSFGQSGFLHLVGGPKERKKGPYGVPKYPYHQYYQKHPDNETELVEFLKVMQGRGK